MWSPTSRTVITFRTKHVARKDRRQKVSGFEGGESRLTGFSIYKRNKGESALLHSTQKTRPRRHSLLPVDKNRLFKQVKRQRCSRLSLPCLMHGLCHVSAALMSVCCRVLEILLLIVFCYTIHVFVTPEGAGGGGFTAPCFNKYCRSKVTRRSTCANTRSSSVTILFLPFMYTTTLVHIPGFSDGCCLFRLHHKSIFFYGPLFSHTHFCHVVSGNV